MNIGIIFCAYDCNNNLHQVLEPWLQIKNEIKTVEIAAVHGQFKEYHELGCPDIDHETENSLVKFKLEKRLDFLYIQNPIFNSSPRTKIYQTEAEIRDKALQWLLTRNLDYVWLLDGDEFYTIEQIRTIIEFIEKDDNKFFTWFSFPFKNYIFDGNQWIKGFCPPRIFRVSINEFNLKKIYWDNDFLYSYRNQDVDYKSLPGKIVPAFKINNGIKHLTWLHSNGQKKYEYQMKHFGHCGYKWNYDTNKLEFNLEYHKKYNIPIPEIFNDI